MLYRVFPDAHRLRHCAQLGRSRSAATLSVPETEQSVPRTLARCICRLAVDSSFFKQSFPPINSRISQVNAFDSEELRCVSFNAPCKHICPPVHQPHQNPAYCWTLQNVPNGHPAPWFQCSLRGVLKLVRNTAPCYETIVCFPALPWVVAFHAAATVVHCRRSRSLPSDGDLQISFARARL